MKVGDLVRVIAIPEFSASDDPEARTVFARCVGRAFSFIDITADSLVELEVAEVARAGAAKS